MECALWNVVPDERQVSECSRDDPAHCVADAHNGDEEGRLVGGNPW